MKKRKNYKKRHANWSICSFDSASSRILNSSEQFQFSRTFKRYVWYQGLQSASYIRTQSNAKNSFITPTRLRSVYKQRFSLRKILIEWIGLFGLWNAGWDFSANWEFQAGDNSNNNARLPPVREMIFSQSITRKSSGWFPKQNSGRKIVKIIQEFFVLEKNFNITAKYKWEKESNKRQLQLVTWVFIVHKWLNESKSLLRVRSDGDFT